MGDGWVSRGFRAVVELDGDVELRVLDSTADIRYLVIPLRPPGSEDMTEQLLDTRRDDRRRSAGGANPGLRAVAPLLSPMIWRQSAWARHDCFGRREVA